LGGRGAARRSRRDPAPPFGGHVDVRRAAAPAARGVEAYAESWDRFFAAAPKPPAFDIVKMTIAAGRDAAFAVALMRCAVDERGRGWEPLDFRLTMGLRKTEGRWMIVHEHHSVPASD